MERLIRNRSLFVKLLSAGMGTIILIAVLWLGATFYFLQRSNSANDIRTTAYHIMVQLLQLRRYETEFMLRDLTSKDFYETGEAYHLKDYGAVIESVREEIEKLRNLFAPRENPSIDELRVLLDRYEEEFLELAAAYRERGFMTYGFEGQWNEIADELEQDFERINVPEFQIDLLEMRRDEKNYLLRKDEKYVRALFDHLTELRGDMQERTGEEYVEVIEDLKIYETAFNNYLSISEKIGVTEDLGLQGDFGRIFLAIDPIIEKILQESVSASETALRNLIRMCLLFLIIGLVLGSVIFYFFSRSITSRLKVAVSIAEQVAAGNLTVGVHSENGQDEVSVLVKALGRMTKNLRDQTHQIVEGVSALSSSASEISISVTQLAAGASETGTAVNETTATLEEVRQTAQSSNQRAQEVADTAKQTAQISQNGKKATDDTIERMADIREQMESIGESIMRLSEQSQAISKIIGTVNDLADQSNLLSVNAAIEASKAGEQGKGFSVVAQEIKNMAEQSKQATIQVQSILNDIQKATTGAVMSAEQGSKAVEAGVKQSTQAGESILALANSVMESAQAASEIAISSQEQLVGIGQVVQAMEGIKQASSQNADSTVQLQTTAKSLDELGEKLKESSERYKV